MLYKEYYSNIIRLWDVAAKSVMKKVEISAAPAGIELSQDGTIFTIPYGNKVAFFDADRYVLWLLVSLSIWSDI